MPPPALRRLQVRTDGGGPNGIPSGPVPPRPVADHNLQVVGALTVRQVSAPCSCQQIHSLHAKARRQAVEGPDREVVHSRLELSDAFARGSHFLRQPSRPSAVPTHPIPWIAVNIVTWPRNHSRNRETLAPLRGDPVWGPRGSRRQGERTCTTP